MLSRSNLCCFHLPSIPMSNTTCSSSVIPCVKKNAGAWASKSLPTCLLLMDPIRCELPILFLLVDSPGFPVRPCQRSLGSTIFRGQHDKDSHTLAPFLAV